MNKMKMFFLVIMVSYVMLFITSFSIWWGFFIFFTMVALMKMKFYLTPSYSMLLYYLVQELSGVFFMMGVSMNFQFILIMVKGGFSPFHNWLNLVMKSLKGQVFMWMMTWQKMPYYLILSQLLGWNLVLLLIVGSIIPLVQVLFLMNYKTILFLLMVSSGNNLLVYSYFNFSHFLIILPIYLFMMNNMVGMVSLHGNMYMGVEVIYMLMGMPGSIPFMIKLMMLTGFMESGLFFFLFMMTMVFNLTVSLNILLNMNSKFSMMNKSFMFMIMSLCLVVFL